VLVLEASAKQFVNPESDATLRLRYQEIMALCSSEAATVAVMAGEEAAEVITTGGLADGMTLI
jgi:hypothetical protein